MVLTNGQEKGLKIAVKRFKDKEPYTVIAGFAGTGKTTLVKYIIDAIGMSEDEVVYATLTGKAALVLRNKGCSNSMTLHKLLYFPKEVDGCDEVEFVPRKFLENPPKLIVVDEASMVSKEIFDLLLSHKVHVIFLGDPFQLPAISESASILDEPHVFLTEITRQALDSPIIRLSMDIREGKALTYGGDKDARVIPMDKVSKRLLLGADIVLCGKNATRRYLNDEIRKLKWGQQYQVGPVNGEKLICNHNYWKIADKLGSTPLVNGSIGILTDISMHDTKKLKPKLTGVFTDEVGNVFRKKDMNIDYQLLATGNPTVNQQNFREFTRTSRPLEFDYAYAVTCHKYQGSEAEKVLVFDEWLGDAEYHRRWLYSAATRGRRMLVIVK